MQYYSYMLQIRDLSKTTVNNFGRLFQQYVVDMYAKVEATRLAYLNSKSGQKKIRSEMYKTVHDAFKNCKSDLSNIGIINV